MTAAPTPRASPYVVSRAYDTAFFLLPPAAGLALGAFFAASGWSTRTIALHGEPRRLVGVAIGVLIHAHLVAVLARSHLRAELFRRHVVRFAVVPPVLFVALLASERVAALSIVVATFWDVYHSGAQTFGLARIYDRNAGRVDEPLGRRLDFLAQQCLYAGPIAAGVSLSAHLAAFDEFAAFPDPASLFLARIPHRVSGAATGLAQGVLVLGGAFLLGYVAYRLHRIRKGERASPQALLLVVVTAACSILSWGFDRWGEAFFVMNFFHAVQYLALVYATEGDHLRARLRLPPGPLGRAATLALFLSSVAAYGAAVELGDPSFEALWAVSMVVSLMHFWYDGFIWSVRRAEV